MEANHVLVCVTGQKTCEKLIVEGARLAQELDAQLSVLHVAKQGLNFLGNPIEGEALEYLYKISSEHGADMMLIRADDVGETIARYAEKIRVNHIVMGRSRREGWDMTNEFRLKKPEIEMHVVLT